MELRLLRYFLTVAKEQSFTKAAEQLHITQPTLSRQMAAFEEDLGITLFIRNGKKISLNCRLLLQVILEPMQESWRQMDWGIPYLLRALQSIGEKTSLCSGEFLLKLRQVR